MTDQLEVDHGYEAAERAAIYEFEAGMTREEAEAKVRREIKSSVVIELPEDME
jgi:hypothetical protein